MSQVYYIFAIKCVKDNSYYLGVSTKSVANTMSYMLDINKRDNTKYVKFAEKVKQHGRNAFVCSRLPTTYEKKETAEIVVFNKLTKLPEERVMNDSIINPERHECEACHQRVRVDFMEKHKTVYCKAQVFAELDELF